MSDLISREEAIKYLMTNVTWYSEDGYEADEDEKRSAIKDLINGVPIVDAVPVDKAISVIQEMIEYIEEDFPLLDFNSRYMMERGMRMALIQIKKLRKDGISNE